MGTKFKLSILSFNFYNKASCCCCCIDKILLPEFSEFSFEWFASRKFDRFWIFLETIPGNVLTIRWRSQNSVFFDRMESVVFFFLVSVVHDDNDSDLC